MSYRVNEEVRVFDVNGSRVGQPEGGWPGTVIKVGRRYATVSYRGWTAQFMMDGGRINDARNHQWIMTLEQVARQQKATETLSASGVELSPGHSLTPEQIEALAALAASFNADSPII